MSSAKALHTNALTIKYADDVLLAIPIHNYADINSTIDSEILHRDYCTSADAADCIKITVRRLTQSTT